METPHLTRIHISMESSIPGFRRPSQGLHLRLELSVLPALALGRCKALRSLLERCRSICTCIQAA